MEPGNVATTARKKPVSVDPDCGQSGEEPGNVVGITYFSHEMSEQDINNLLAGNPPKADGSMDSLGS